MPTQATNHFKQALANPNTKSLSDVFASPKYKVLFDKTHRNIILYGGRRGGKSTAVAEAIVLNIMRYKQLNYVVLRANFNTHRKTTLRQLITATKILGVDHLFEYSDNESGVIKFVYKPTGQRVEFAGLNMPDTIKSTKFLTGGLHGFWAEEASEIKSYQAFITATESMDTTATLPNPNYDPNIPDDDTTNPKNIQAQPTDYDNFAWNHVYITFNPTNAGHWLKEEFFDTMPNEDNTDENTNYRTDTIKQQITIYDNPYLSKADIEYFEALPEREFKVRVLGEWGRTEGQVYTNWERSTNPITINQLTDKHNRTLPEVVGIDFGFANDPTVLTHLYMDIDKGIIYIQDAIYLFGASDADIFNTINDVGWSSLNIIADNDLRLISLLKNRGLSRLYVADKGNDSINTGIRILQSFKIVVAPNLKQFETEMYNYAYKRNKQDQQLNQPEDKFNHGMDSMRYAASWLYKQLIHAAR
jgi:phage terminase large subunit